MVMLTNFIYSKKAGIVFAYVPKVACTNWKCILRYLDGHVDYLDPKIAHDRNRSGLAYLSSLPNAAELLSDPDVPKLTCVRNPYTRALSAYLNKVKRFAFDNASPECDPYFHMIYQKMDAFQKSTHPDLPGVTFGCFLDWLESSGDPLVENEHWVPQTSIIGKGEVKFAYIGRIESIEIDAPILLQRMGCDIAFPSQKAVSFPPTHAGNLLQNYYLDEERERVRRIYAADFECLGYDPKSI